METVTQRDEGEAEAVVAVTLDFPARANDFEGSPEAIRPVFEEGSPTQKIRNIPGCWEFFLSHIQAEAAWEANDLYHRLGPELCWLDVKMQDKGVKAMEEGVRNCKVFLLIMSDKYFQSDYCKSELEWALSSQKPVVVVHIRNTALGDRFRQAQELGFHGLGGEESVELNLRDPEMADVTVRKILSKAMRHGLSVHAQRTSSFFPSIKWLTVVVSEQKWRDAHYQVLIETDDGEESLKLVSHKEIFTCANDISSVPDLFTETKGTYAHEITPTSNAERPTITFRKIYGAGPGPMRANSRPVRLGVADHEGRQRLGVADHKGRQRLGVADHEGRHTMQPGERFTECAVNCVLSCSPVLPGPLPVGSHCVVQRSNGLWVHGYVASSDDGMLPSKWSARQLAEYLARMLGMLDEVIFPKLDGEAFLDTLNREDWWETYETAGFSARHKSKIEIIARSFLVPRAEYSTHRLHSFGLPLGWHAAKE